MTKELWTYEIKPEEVKEIADLYYQWKKMMDKSGHLISPDQMTKEEYDLFKEFMDKIAPVFLMAQELCKDDEYLHGPFDFVRGLMILKQYPFN